MKNSLLFYLLIGIGAIAAIRFIHRRNRQDSQIRENFAEVERHNVEMGSATQAASGAIPAISTFGELPLVSSVLNPFLSYLGAQTQKVEILPSWGGYSDLGEVPQVNQTGRSTDPNRFVIFN